ncbi:MAG TPA: winged helix DNA-binding protein [Azospirillaceae bacterium]|nr:winged helix DNA-binding protein [Azospirillaceae bacterium]
MQDAPPKPPGYMTATPCAQTLTRLELALIRVWEAFSRWATELNTAVSGEPFGFQDVVVLHAIRMRQGPRNLTEVLRFLNRSDVSNIQYSLRKLERAGLVRRSAGATKRESSYALTPLGTEVTDRFSARRQELLVGLAGEVLDFAPQMERAAAVLERLVGLYDQSTQSVLNERIVGRADETRTE